MGCKLSKSRLFRRNRSEATRDCAKGGGRALGTNDERIPTYDRNTKHTREHEEYQVEPSDIVTTDKEAISELLQVGLDEKIANELVLLRERGSLKTTGDLVAVLEKNNTDYKVQLEGSTLVRVNSLGDLSFEKVEEEKVSLNPADQININTASKTSLEAIKGVGPTLALRIIQYREEHGPFERVEDIVSVKGVSNKLLDKIASQITTDSSKTLKIPTLPLKNDKKVCIASWNLLSFSSHKADNDGVREVVCRTILENG